MNKIEQAVSCFKQGYMCSQAVFSTYAPGLGLNRETALKVSGAFGGGVGRTGEVCGAVSGALMALGLKHASTSSSEEEKQKIYTVARKFMSRFKDRNGTITCRELLKCDISTPEGLKYAREQKIIATLCPNFIRDAAEIIEQLL